MTPPKRPMAALCSASFCEGLCASLILSFLPLYARISLGEESYLVAACIVALPALAFFAATNVWGAFVDATGEFRRVERLGLAALAACLGCLCVVERSAGVIAAVVGFALVFGALRPTLQSHATLLDEKAKAVAISVILLFQSAGWLVGGPLFGHVYDMEERGSAAVIFAGPCCLCLLVALLLPRWIDDPRIGGRTAPRGALRRRGLVQALLGELDRVYRNPELLRVCIVVFLVSCSNWCYFGMFSFIYTEEMIFVPAIGTWRVPMLGWTLALSTLSAVLIFRPLGRAIDRAGGRTGLLVSIGLYLAYYTAMILVRDPWVASVLFVVPIYPVFLISASALAAEATRADERAGGIGIIHGVFGLAMAAGSLIGGLAGDSINLRAVIGAAAAISLGSLGAFVLLLRRGRPAPQKGGLA